MKITLLIPLSWKLVKISIKLFKNDLTFYIAFSKFLSLLITILEDKTESYYNQKKPGILVLLFNTIVLTRITTVNFIFFEYQNNYSEIEIRSVSVKKNVQKKLINFLHDYL